MKHLLLCCLFILACSGIKDGKIHAKRWYEAYSSTTLIYCGKGCLIPTRNYHPRRFELCYSKVVEDEMESNCQDVYLETWQRFRVGDYIKFQD